MNYISSDAPRLTSAFLNDSTKSSSVTMLHGGSRNEETRSITNRVFNVEQTEETQVRTSIQALDINNNPQDTWGRTDYI